MGTRKDGNANVNPKRRECKCLTRNDGKYFMCLAMSSTQKRRGKYATSFSEIRRTDAIDPWKQVHHNTMNVKSQCQSPSARAVAKEYQEARHITSNGRGRKHRKEMSNRIRKFDQTFCGIKRLAHANNLRIVGRRDFETIARYRIGQSILFAWNMRYQWTHA